MRDAAPLPSPDGDPASQDATGPVDVAATGLAQEATRLLLGVAAGDAGAAEAYDELLFEPVMALVAQRGHLLVADASRLTGTDRVGVPFVSAGDLAEVANDVAVHALARARRTAGRFQPGRGDGASWAFRAASLSYVDVVRDRTGYRRRLQQVPTEQEDLLAACDAAACEPEPSVRYEQQEALDRALGALTPAERKAVLLHKQFEYSYAEIGQLLFGDPQAVRDVDRLLNGALRKIRRADKVYRAGHADG